MSCPKDYIGESHKKIERSGSLKKQGSVAGETDAAHKFSWGTLNVIETHTPGAPMGEKARRELTAKMNAAANLRIKSRTGNRRTDERNDGKMVQHFLNKTPIRSRQVVARAEQAFSGAKTLPNPKYATALGKMKVHNAATGRSHTLKNHHQHKPRAQTKLTPSRRR
ncbi:hypothetical protein CAOG_06172 [Capsaspora owczarzaki ATCC 30864]|uniref:Uncharacterized protein n=1 Tax=Capsaspora owczarzaki (strain ATCC 30864) TaxID=595528 RepID=A0A0D2VW62_CAPO3|nr:hypothetical protein CAOG_06172 [Capsaspora owczarzaki ATCC 30864]KJE95757.1 hypothetical protein CAOG_006172 [Capsaspora owczarzaki ATCC 30864]|eukprot:XP_004345762.1 hypothetical protein CAOG_06172 [Capsaspora owczarzaki ATCC 30864]